MDSNKWIVPTAKTLVTDETLILNWNRLAHTLIGLDATVNRKLKRLFDNEDEPLYQLFVTILTLWVEGGTQKANLPRLIEVLRTEGFNDVADKLEGKPVIFGLQKLVYNFTGRKSDLQKLKQILHSFISIYGLSGIGKTALARELITNLKRDEKFHRIFLSGVSENALLNDLQLLAEEYNKQYPLQEIKTGMDNTISELFEQIFFKLEETTLNILMIIDDIDDTNDLVISLLNKLDTSKNFVIVTSQNESVLHGMKRHTFNLSKLSDSDAFKFIDTYIPGERDFDVKHLCELLENFPLAMQQAIAYIKTQRVQLKDPTRYPLSQYISEFDLKKKVFLSFPVGRLCMPTHAYAMTTFITWNMALKKIGMEEHVGKLSLILVKLISFLALEKIDRDRLLKLLNVGNFYNVPLSAPNLLKDAQALLGSYSLIDVDRNLISVHRLVQEVIRIYGNEKGNEQLLMLDLIISKTELSDCFFGLHDITTYSICKALIEHEKLVKNHKEKLAMLSRIHSFTPETFPYQVSGINLCNSATVLELHKKISARMTALLGVDDPYARAVEKDLKWLLEDKARQCFRIISHSNVRFFGGVHCKSMVFK